MKTLIAFCQKTGRRLRQFINRQISKLTRAGQFKGTAKLFDLVVSGIDEA